MEKKLGALAELVNGKLTGDPQIVIRGIAGLREAKEDEISFLSNMKYVKDVQTSRAAALICSPQFKSAKPAIICENPYLAFAKILSLFHPVDRVIPQGIHPTAVVHAKARVSEQCCVGPYVVIEEGAIVENGCVLYPGVYIGKNSNIGESGIIYSNVSIREGVKIGKRVIIHGGAVIGSDGFGFVRTAEGQLKIPQVGGVEIGDDVEVGANSCIARGTIGNTVIGSGTKIDNLVQIAHNVQVGKNCTIVALVGISGSTIVEDGVTIAGQAGVAGHIRLGKNSVIAAQAGVTKDVNEGEIVSGFPAQPHRTAKKLHAELNNLPALRQKVKELEERVTQLTQK